MGDNIKPMGVGAGFVVTILACYCYSPILQNETDAEP